MGPIPGGSWPRARHLSGPSLPPRLPVPLQDGVTAGKLNREAGRWGGIEGEAGVQPGLRYLVAEGFIFKILRRNGASDQAHSRFQATGVVPSSMPLRSLR